MEEFNSGMEGEVAVCYNENDNNLSLQAVPLAGIRHYRKFALEGND